MKGQFIYALGIIALWNRWFSLNHRTGRKEQCKQTDNANKPFHTHTAIKKAHPEGCAKKVLSPVAATQTIRYLHREMRETPFYQGMFPLANSNYSVCVA